jgi:hypothetical protein
MFVSVLQSVFNKCARVTPPLDVAGKTAPTVGTLIKKSSDIAIPVASGFMLNA